jgi:hypothetical protein
MFGEALVGNDSSLFESVHAFANLDVDPSAVRGDNVHEVVLFDDFVGDDADVHAHVFVAAHWCFKVEIFEVAGDGASVLVGQDDAVDEAFGSGEACGGCADISWIVELVSANGES